MSKVLNNWFSMSFGWFLVYLNIHTSQCGYFSLVLSLQNVVWYISENIQTLVVHQNLIYYHPAPNKQLHSTDFMLFTEQQRQSWRCASEYGQYFYQKLTKICLKIFMIQILWIPYSPSMCPSNNSCKEEEKIIIICLYIKSLVSWDKFFLLHEFFL